MKVKSNFWANLKKMISSKTRNKTADYDIDDVKLLEKIKNKQAEPKNPYCWSNRQMFKFWLFWLVVVILGYFVYNTLNLIFLFIAAFILSMIVESLIVRFQSKKLKRWISIWLSYFIVILVLFVLFLVFIPFLTVQTVELVSLWLNYLAELQTNISTLWADHMIMNCRFLPNSFKEFLLSTSFNPDFVSQFQTVLQENLSDIISFWKLYVAKAGNIMISFVSGFTKFLVSFWTLMVLSIFFSIDKDLITKFLAKIWWKENYEINCLKIKKMYHRLWVWFKARILMSIIVALVVWLALMVLWWFGIYIPNKLWIALFIWLLDIIPYVSVIISWLILFVVSMLYNPFLPSLLVVGIYVVINMILGNVVLPIFMNKALWVNASLILIGMIFWGMIMWFFGVLLAVPIVVIILLLFEDKEQLNKEDEEFNISEIVAKSASKIRKRIPNKKKHDEMK